MIDAALRAITRTISTPPHRFKKFSTFILNTQEKILNQVCIPAPLCGRTTTASATAAAAATTTTIAASTTTITTTTANASQLEEADGSGVKFARDP